MIGFSGPVEEKEKRKDHSDSIIDGIGKSSFCARFIKPHQVRFLLNATQKRPLLNAIELCYRYSIRNQDVSEWHFGRYM